MYIISNRFKNTIYLCWLKVRRSLHKKKPYSKKKLLIFIFWQRQYSNRIVWGQYRKCCIISFIVHEISFRDVSLVPSVTKSGIHRHLQAENILLCDFFALEHQNCAHCGAFQHVNLQCLRKEDEDWFNQLNEKRFGASLSGYVFSIILYHLVTELFNKEAKGTSGLFHCSFSTNIDLVNSWVNSVHMIYIPSLKLLKDSNYISKPL